MATATQPSPVLGRTRSRLLRTLVVPLGFGGLATLVALAVGHITVGLLFTAGLALGAVNGLLAELAASKLTPENAPTRGMIISSSMRRLGAITVVAFALAYLARPLGWVLLLGVAFYQLLALATALGQAAKEARLG